MLRRILRRPGVQAFIGRIAALYLRLVWSTSRFEVVPPDAYERVVPDEPVIIAMWHGEHFLMPFGNRPRGKAKVMISRHRDGAINAVVAERLGIEVIRGSGSHGAQNLDKRGAVALIEMIRALEDGFTVAMTADVPKVSRVAGPGIVALAKHSGRAIYPAAMVTSRHRRAKSWDRAAVPLPFGRIVATHGPPVRVAADADDAALEEARRAVERGLEEAHAFAYAVAAGRRPE